MRTRAVVMIVGVCLLVQGCGSTAAPPALASESPRAPDTIPADTATSESFPDETPTDSLTPTPDLSRLVVQRRTSSSPGGSWTAVITVAYPPAGSISHPHTYYTRLEVASDQEGYSLGVLEKWSEIGLGALTPIVIGWSSDEAFMFFADQSIPDGCARFPYLSRLRRLDLGTGQISDLPNSLERRISLSPGSLHVASISRAERQLLLYSVEEESLLSFPFDPKTEEWTAGEFAWSPDGTAVVIPVLHGASCGEDSTSLIGIDLVNLQLLIYLDQHPVVAPYTDWVDSSTIRLSGGAGETVLVEVNQGKVLE